ncbi:phospholipid-binding lipoprotein MlaA [Aeromonas sp. RU39B]|uniref:MlaA family lipoprotein n=1 Tax=Aeromonas sp. RU39B TaxID=1907416 RepID=UPI000956F299|nr:VacJ family lipoprotein [Aeromonas sp. RU39B]SIR09615.1 phospholipid-binding lipoprotein MlaA [Aeromonas sp. RU39B]
MQLRVAALLPFLLLAGCAGGPPKEGPPSLPDPSGDKPNAKAMSVAKDLRDPFEGANRAMWAVNYDVLEPYAARPAVHGYAKLPQGVRTGIGNFVENFNEPSSMVNHLLSGDLKGAGTNLGRFTINTTIGVLGIFDVAKHMGLERNMLGFGTLLGRMDIGNGPYMMLPGMGPTTGRELTGDVVDTLYFPYSLLTWPVRVVQWTLGALDSRSKLIPQEPMIDNALDPYGLTKDFYLQYAQSKVDGKPVKLEVSAPAAESKPSTPSDDKELDQYMDEIDK